MFSTDYLEPTDRAAIIVVAVVVGPAIDRAADHLRRAIFDAPAPSDKVAAVVRGLVSSQRKRNQRHTHTRSRSRSHTRARTHTHTHTHTHTQKERERDRGREKYNVKKKMKLEKTFQNLIRMPNRAQRERPSKETKAMKKREKNFIDRCAT